MTIHFNRSQRLGLDLDKHIALDAGAGTGKTTVMAERYVQHLLSAEQRATHLLPAGPRELPKGSGLLRAPPRQRTSPKEWRGLLPSEVVAITFTKKAAAELKARIRYRVGQSRATAVKKGDDEGIFDPRIQEGDIETLMSALDEAPISTIDAFLSQLVSPHLDLVAVHVSREQISEERSPLLVEETLHSAWRIRTIDDAYEAGVRGNIGAFIEARNRLAILLGGQERSAVVLSGMLGKSLFVEEAHHAMLARAQSMGINWSGEGQIPHEVLMDMFLEPVRDEVVDFAHRVQDILFQWVNVYQNHSANYVQACEAQIGTTLTRFNHINALARQPLPTEPGACLQWVWQVAVAATTTNQLENEEPNYLPKGGFPQARYCAGWHPGLLGKSATKGLSKSIKDGVENEAITHSNSLNTEFNGRLGRLVCLLGKSAFLLDPLSDLPHMPEDCELRHQEVPTSFSDLAPTGRLRISHDLQTNVLNDLLLVHRGCQDILTLRKAHESVHDYDDIQKLVADLLLARCPDIVRHVYPSAVVNALDNLGDEPWSDQHISRAMRIAGDDQSCFEDLQRRFFTLQTIRRQYRAFIIDEYQDTNPAHFRLLARLWGHRRLESEEPQRPLGPWDPTICIVGDMKQSIYRFRQAEVTVMRRTVEAIKEANYDEQNEPRLSHLRSEGEARDPRPVGAGESFIRGDEIEGSVVKSKLWEHVSVAFEDDEDTYNLVDSIRKERRILGHIDLTSNHRTLHNLVRTMNGMFDDVFDSRHYVLPGDWHAEPQQLRPARDSKNKGTLEWLLPLQIDVEAPSFDLQKRIDTFADPKAKRAHLEHELIAARLQALIQNRETQVWDSDVADYTKVTFEKEDIRPEEVIILVHSRKHMPDLIQRLQSRGIPVMADRQGALLQRPAVAPLLACLELIAFPHSRHAALALARSPILGFNDSQAHALLTSNEELSWWKKLQQYAPNDSVKRLVAHIEYLVLQGAIHDVFDTVLDCSDLLVAHPDDTSRQNAEAWCALASTIGDELGHEASAIFHRMKALKGLGNKGPSAITTPSGGAVQIMTIHGAKGLQAPVVIVAGIFHAGKSDASLAARNNVLVTPQVVAGRINPWTSRERPDDGLWEFAKRMDHAQRQAERRREFYVALTRVENRLIVVGSPTDTATINQETHNLDFDSKPSMKTMGAMWLDGLRSLSHSNGQENSPWLLDDDVCGQPLKRYEKSELSLNPAALIKDSQLGGDAIKSIHLYHSPDCFPDLDVQTPLQKWNSVESQLEMITPEATPPVQYLHVSDIMRMTSHGLDTSFACPRRHWLSEVRGWNPEPLNSFSNPNTGQTPASIYPPATVFGTLMHRLVEIGLQNPSQLNSPPIIPLPAAWTYDGKDLLDDEATIQRVLAEEGIGSGDSNPEMFAATFDRLAHLGRLVRKGLLGRFASGETHFGYCVEGLRTELPFYFSHNVTFDDVVRTTFSVDGPRPQALVDHVDVIFDGRADLVLALRDEEGKGCLQVVDLKTKDCRDTFNPENPDAGSRLQTFNGDQLAPFPSTSAERALLNEHRLQLTLYSLALEAIEQQKPESEQRRVLPPSLLIGASGRVVQLTDDEYEEAKATLSKHLHWMAQLAATPDSLEEPSRLPVESTHLCSQCPFSRGEIRLCGPEGTPLGIIDSED
jgi:superfamily I DNA/RNA helicase